jgi:sulfur relay protein TusB/DsrH
VDATLLVLTASPDEPRTASCLGIARTLREAGKDVEVLLLQDAVLLPTQRSSDQGSPLNEATREGVRFLVLEDDLRLRGFGKIDLDESAHLVTYRAAVRRMAEAGISVKGCF